jgi:hypothetical protein
MARSTAFEPKSGGCTALWEEAITPSWLRPRGGPGWVT